LSPASKRDHKLSPPLTTRWGNKKGSSHRAMSLSFLIRHVLLAA
jgi:hypothetical protein